MDSPSFFPSIVLAVEEIPYNTTFITVTVIGILSLFVVFLGHRTRDILPPGPRRLPIIGNAHQLPTETPWLTFTEWKKIYGDILHVDIFGQSIIVINSSEVAKDLLDKRSSIYSDRPHFVMACDLMGYGETFVLQPYGDNWRKQRRLVAHDFGQTAAPRYHNLQEKEARILVRNILQKPKTLVSEIKLRIAIIIFRITYGYYIKGEDDPFLTSPLIAMEHFNIASTPGNFLVDFIPVLRHLPRWVPGAGFLKTAEDWRQIFWDSCWNPFEWCKDNLVTGETLMPNLCGNYIEAGGDLSGDAQDKLVWAASSVMGGGLDTNMSSALTFFMAMILNPEVQAKAQAEIDSVVGRDRLPTISDRPNLPYVRSILAEVFRYCPSIPLCVPHALSQDDVYEGLFLPKGAWVMPNVWGMLHDPEVYPEPMEFKPERYKGSEAEMAKVNDLVFGFGRRACPGMHFAEGTLFGIIATTLATCDILPGVDENSKEILPTYAYTSGTIPFPKPFTLRLKPRSPQALALLAEGSTTTE